MRPDFTILTTLWDTEDHLIKLIDSVLEQTHQSWELRILADGPHPATRERMAKLQTFDDLRGRLHYSERTRFEGCVGNLLRGWGIREAAGKNICWIGHDCILYRDYLETHWQHLQDQECLSVVHINHWHANDKKFARYGRFPVKDPNEVQSGEIDLTCFACPTRFALQVNAFDESVKYRYDADFDTFDRLRRVLPVVCSPKVCAAHF